MTGEGQRNIPSLSDYAPPARADANGNLIPPTPQEQTTAAFRWVDSLIDRNLTDTELLTSFEASGLTAADLRTMIAEAEPSWTTGKTDRANRNARKVFLQRALNLIEGRSADANPSSDMEGAETGESYKPERKRRTAR